MSNTSNHLFDLPSELVRYIFDLSGNVSTVKKNVLSELAIKFIMNELIDTRQNAKQNIGSRYFGYRHQMVIQLKHTYSPEKRVEIFDILEKCKCCKDHTTNCPRDIYQGHWSRRHSRKKTCKCGCRHFKRILENTMADNRQEG